MTIMGLLMGFRVFAEIPAPAPIVAPNPSGTHKTAGDEQLVSGTSRPCPQGLIDLIKSDESAALVPVTPGSCTNQLITKFAKVENLEDTLANNPRTSLGLPADHRGGFLSACIRKDDLVTAPNDTKFQLVANYYGIEGMCSAEMSKSILAQAALNRILGQRADFGVTPPDPKEMPKAYQAYQQVKLASEKCPPSFAALKQTTDQGLAALQAVATLEATKSKASGDEKNKVEQLIQSFKSTFPWLRSDSFKSILGDAISRAKSGKAILTTDLSKDVEAMVKQETVRSITALNERNENVMKTHRCVNGDSKDCFADSGVRRILAGSDPIMDFDAARNSALRTSQDASLSPEVRDTYAKRADTYAELAPMACRAKTRDSALTNNEIATHFARDVVLTVVTVGVAGLAAKGAGAAMAAAEAAGTSVARAAAYQAAAFAVSEGANLANFGQATQNTYKSCVQGQAPSFGQVPKVGVMCSNNALDAQLMAVGESRGCAMAVLFNAMAALPYLGKAAPALAKQIKALANRDRAAETAAAQGSGAAEKAIGQAGANSGSVGAVTLKDGTRIPIRALKPGESPTVAAQEIAEELSKSLKEGEVDGVIQQLEKIEETLPKVSKEEAAAAIRGEKTINEQGQGVANLNMNSHMIRELREKLAGHSWQLERSAASASGAHYAATTDLGGDAFAEMTNAGLFTLPPAEQQAALDTFNALNNFASNPTLAQIPGNLPPAIAQTLTKLREALKPLHAEIHPPAPVPAPAPRIPNAPSPPGVPPSAPASTGAPVTISPSNLPPAGSLANLSSANGGIAIALGTALARNAKSTAQLANDLEKHAAEIERLAQGDYVKTLEAQVYREAAKEVRGIRDMPAAITDKYRTNADAILNKYNLQVAP